MQPEENELFTEIRPKHRSMIPFSPCLMDTVRQGRPQTWLEHAKQLVMQTTHIIKNHELPCSWGRTLCILLTKLL